MIIFILLEYYFYSPLNIIFYSFIKIQKHYYVRVIYE